MPYAIMERIQVTIFFVQEFILSGLYVWKARGFLNWRPSRNSRSKAHQRLRLMMMHLILSNIIVLLRTSTRLPLSLNFLSNPGTEMTSGFTGIQRGCRGVFVTIRCSREQSNTSTHFSVLVLRLVWQHRPNKSALLQQST